MDKRKLLFITIFSAAIVLIIYGLYYFFWRKPLVVGPEQPVVTAPIAPGALPLAPAGLQPGKVTGEVPAAPGLVISPVARGGITAAPEVFAGTAISPSPSTGNGINFYDPAQAKFFRLTPDGKTEQLSSKSFYNVKNVVWSPKSDKGIIEYPDDTKLFFNFNTGQQATLPKHWEGFSFDPQGERITAKSEAIDPDNRWLLISNPDGSGAKPLLPLGENGDRVALDWSPAGGVIGFSRTGNALGFARQQIIPLGENNERLNPLIVEGLDFRPKWAPNGDKLVYSTFNSDNDYAPTLWITNAQGDAMGSGRRKLNVATWADKCAFKDNNTMICAVPNSLPEGAGLEPRVAYESPDTLYKIDLNTGMKNVLAVPEGNMSMGNLLLSEDKSTLYFTDNQTGKLRTMRLE